MSAICRNQSNDLLCKSMDWIPHNSNTGLKYVKRGIKKNHILFILILKNTKTEAYSSKTISDRNENLSNFFLVLKQLFIYLFLCTTVPLTSGFSIIHSIFSYILKEKSAGNIIVY